MTNNKRHSPQTCQCGYTSHPCLITTTEKGGNSPSGTNSKLTLTLQHSTRFSVTPLPSLTLIALLPA